ncbi:hypothetical protein [Larkinella harenae]
MFNTVPTLEKKIGINNLKNKVINFSEFGLFSLQSFLVGIILSFKLSEEDYASFSVFQSLNNLFSAIYSVGIVDAIIYKNKENLNIKVNRDDFNVISILYILFIFLVMLIFKDSEITSLNKLLIGISLCIYQNVYYLRRKNLFLNTQKNTIVYSIVSFIILLIVLFVIPNQYYIFFLIVGLYPICILIKDYYPTKSLKNNINYSTYFFSSILFWLPINSAPLLFYLNGQTDNTVTYRYILNVYSPIHQISSAMCAFYFIPMLKIGNSADRLKYFKASITGNESKVLLGLCLICSIVGYFYVASLTNISIPKYILICIPLILYTYIPFFNNYNKSRNSLKESILIYFISFIPAILVYIFSTSIYNSLFIFMVFIFSIFVFKIMSASNEN